MYRYTHTGVCVYMYNEFILIPLIPVQYSILTDLLIFSILQYMEENSVGIAITVPLQ